MKITGGECRQPKEPGCVSLTDVNGGLPPQQQLQTLAVVGQAAVVQRRAAFHRLLVQVQTTRGAQTRREKERRLQTGEIPNKRSKASYLFGMREIKRLRSCVATSLCVSALCDITKGDFPFFSKMDCRLFTTKMLNLFAAL